MSAVESARERRGAPGRARGDIFDGAALTILLAVATLVVLVGLSHVPTRAAPRK